MSRQNEDLQNRLNAALAENTRLQQSNELQEAARANGAFNAKQLADLAAGMTEADADGNLCIKIGDDSLPVNKGLQLMSQMPEYKNYFAKNVRQSVGGSNVSQPDFTNCTFEEFKAWRNSS